MTAPHSLHACRSVEQFCREFHAAAGYPVKTVADDLIGPGMPRAVLLVGSLPLGMVSGTSDVDFMVLVDTGPDGSCDPLRAAFSVRSGNGLRVRVTLISTPAIKQIYKDLRRRGPDLSEAEIMTLGSLSSGWLAWQSDDYLSLRGIRLSDPALDVYCSTRNFSFALIFHRKAAKALGLADIPLALHLGRASVEMAYLAYFASEGFPYLGSKWLAQLGHAQGSGERLSRHPLLNEGTSLIFPSGGSTLSEAQSYVRAVSGFLTCMRELVSRKKLFRIAFDTCPQIFKPREIPGRSPGQLVHELFESQVERTPYTIAVQYGELRLTYAELNSRANQLARGLVSRGVGPDQLVGLYLDRCVEMVVSLLAILKSGAAYVPLDPEYPSERLLYMLKDSAPRVVLTHNKCAALLPVTGAEVFVLEARFDEISQKSTQDLSANNLGLTAQLLAYVIYTSGSTGQPKAAAMSHASLVNLIEWHRENLPADNGLRVLQFSALSFDVAFQEVFCTLCTGGTLVLLDTCIRRNPWALAMFLSSQSIERIFVPPLVLRALADCYKRSGEVPGGLRDVITAGEQLRISPEIRDLFKQLPGCKLHNHYGPTETHVATALTLTGEAQKWPRLPAIGQPIADTQVYILDERTLAVQTGVTGEIYVGGKAVARGYLGRPELTAQRFVPDPFCTDGCGRLYRTGDLGRWRTDGSLEYLGRNDDQVKIRGYRIEPGEIEAQLVRHPQVREAAVVAREDIHGEKLLVAYITCGEQSGPSLKELRTQLTAAFPEHMVPREIVKLNALPLTPNGKLDRCALPALQNHRDRKI